MVIGIEGDSSRGRVASRPMKTNDLRNNASHVIRYMSPNVENTFLGIQLMGIWTITLNQRTGVLFVRELKLY